MHLLLLPWRIQHSTNLSLKITRNENTVKHHGVSKVCLKTYNNNNSSKINPSPNFKVRPIKLIC